MTLSDRVAARHLEKTGMAVLVRTVASHNWGWFSTEDGRMHIQTVDRGFLHKPTRIKFWLEQQGKRIFAWAEGKISAPETKALKAAVRANRANLEVEWVAFMLQNRWLEARLRGSIVTLVAYPGHNTFTRDIDLRQICPGCYEPDNEDGWDARPPELRWDHEHGMLQVGRKSNRDHWRHIDVSRYLFQD